MKIVAPLTPLFNSALMRSEPHPFIPTPRPLPGSVVTEPDEPTTPTNPTPTDPTPTNPTPTNPGTATFNAALSEAPAGSSRISGTVTIKVTGTGIVNVELLPEFGYSPVYGRFSVNAAGTEATLSWNTTGVADGQRAFRVSAFNRPPGGSGSTEINCGVRSWIIDNVADPVDPTTGEIDYFGDSTIWGYLQGGAQANPTPVQRFGTALTTQINYTENNLGVSGQGTTRLLNGEYPVAGDPTLDELLAASTASVCIFNHMINDASSNQDLVTVTQYGNNVRNIIGKVRAAGKFIVWETPNPSTYLNLSAYLTELHSICSSFGVPVIDQHAYLTKYASANNVSMESLIPDGAHPSQTTYNLKGDFAALRFRNIMEQDNSQGNTYADGAGAIPAGTDGGTGGGTTNPYPPGSYPAMLGPTASNFTDTPVFFDDFDDPNLPKWKRGDFVNGGNLPEGTMRVANGELQQTGNPNSMFTGRNSYNYSVICTDPSLAGPGPGFEQTFGVFQVEARLPEGRGYWPSFWLLGHPSIHRPEVDVYETYAGGSWDYTYPGNQPSYNSPPYKPSLGPTNIHPQNDPGGYQATHISFNMTQGLPLSDAFHTWTFEWDVGFMKFYFDGVLVQTVTNADTLAWMNQFRLYLYLQLGIEYNVTGGPSSDFNSTPYGWGSKGVHRVKYCAAWQWKKHM